MFNRLEPDTLPYVLSIEPPRSIGPYQVLRSLGVGGMGEVFLAFDPRLKRQVAIKRIRTDVALDLDRQARFKREAELAAGLNHAAIVQVHDLYTDEDTDHIVMEYVAGSSLRRRLKDSGAVSPSQGLSIALSLARGLEYAHGTGVVHRDLKSENVLLTPQGEPKITDFGIAFRTAREDADDTLDAPLTQEGAVLGTFRAMSPEQLVGDPVDARSDLFSFGVLLYELFTAQSPFLAATHRETMQRVLHQEPTPVHEIAPDVPSAVSELIDDLLDKDPLMRPRDAREVVQRLQMLTGDSQTIDAGATLPDGVREIPVGPPGPPDQLATGTAPGSFSADTGPSDSGKSTYSPARRPKWAIPALVVLTVLVVVAFIHWITTPPKPEQLLYVALTKPHSAVASAENESDLLSFAIRSAVLRALLSLDGVAPKTTDDVDESTLGTIDLARAVGADEVITSSYTCQVRNCWVELRRVKVADETVLWSDEAEVPRDVPLDASRSISHLLRGAYAEFPLRPEAGALSVKPEDFKALLEAKKLYTSGTGGSTLTDLLQQVKAIRQSSNQFVDAYIFEARISLRQFRRTQESSLLDEAFSLIRKARELDPGDPYLLFEQVHTQIVAGQFDAAEAALDESEERLSAYAEPLELRARIFKSSGRPQEALELYRLATERRPSAPLLINYARLALQLGDIETARSAIREHRTLLPDSWSARRLLATIEYSIGDPLRAVPLCEELIEEFEDPIDFSSLGLAYLLLGRYDSAAEAFEKAVELAPNNHLCLFNLADSRWLQGRRSEAEGLYRRVLSLIDENGPRRGQDFTVRAQAHAHLGEGQKAVAAIQEAIRMTPGSKDVSYEAALVFALINDRTTAVFHAQEAVRLGCPVRWFRLPWFENLQSDPAFKSLLDGAR